LTTRVDTEPSIEALWPAFAATLSPTTARTYRSGIRHLQRISKTTTLADIDQPTVLRLVRSLGEQGKKAATIEFILTALNRFLGWAVEHGHARTNPLTALNLRSIARQNAGKPLSWVEALVTIEDIRGKVMSPRDRAAYGLMLFLGVRPIKIGGLQLADLSLPRREIRLDRGWVSVPEPLIDELRRYVPWRRVMFSESQWLLPGRNGGRLTPPALRNALWRYDSQIGLRGLRDALAAHLLASGASVESVQATLALRTHEAVRQYVAAR
jgi:site-specific recombinase XerC